MASPALLGGREAGAACNLIPSAAKTFRGALGGTNKPFAAPGDFVEVSAEPGRCDAISPGITSAAEDHVVTVVFKPAGYQPRVVFLTTDSCGSGKIKSLRTACESAPGLGVGNVSCVQTSDTDLAVVERNGERRLAFRFPDTDALLPPAGDGRTLAGPATIAVTGASAALPCGLATTSCAAQSGTVACVDDLYAADGTCQPNVDETFGHFTALPPPNDYASVCFANSPLPCNPTAAELRMTVDAAGNLLLPFNWQGVLATNGGVPVPRLLRGTVRSPLGIAVPDPVFLASYTPEGAKLPPIFEPSADASVVDPDVLTLFGSADAPYTILRIAKRAGTCSNAPGQACVLDGNCPAGGTCPTTCVGGSTPGAACSNDGMCAGGGRCGALFGNFAPLASNGGPIPLSRIPTGTGICQLEPHTPCTQLSDCPGVGNACVTYAFEARTQVALESLYQGTSDQFAFTLQENVDLTDHNGDGDTTDSVITLRDRLTGAGESLGAPAGCGLAGTPEGRAVVRISEPPFNFPAVAVENDVLAFLESEPGQKQCDIDQNGEASGSIARVFRLGTGEIPMSPVRGVDASLVIDGKSLAVSNGRVFFRSSEPEMGARTTTRVSLTSGGTGPNKDSSGSALSNDGRYATFYSAATDLPNPNDFADFANCSSLYVRDRVTNTTEQIDPRADGGPPRCIYNGGGSTTAKMSPDGRFVAFVSDDWNLENTVFDPDVAGAYDVHLRDRCVSNGVAVGGGCVPSNVRVSVAADGSYCASSSVGSSTSPAVSDDGRFIAFVSSCTNFVPGDTNDKRDVFVRDTCRAHGALVPGCVATTERVSGLPGAPDENDNVLSDVDMSADGRYVTFNTQIGVSPVSRSLVRDRLLGTTEVVAIDTVLFSHQKISADGRFILFSSNASNLVPGDSNGVTDLFVRDRLLGTTDRVSVGTDGTEGDQFTFLGQISRDGRFVAFQTLSSTLLGPGGDTNGINDIYVRDRLVNVTKRVSVAYNSAQATVGSNSLVASIGFAISGDGQTVAFASPDANLLPPGTDTNGKADVFVRSVDATDPTGVDNLLFDNNRLTDGVLESLDTGTSTLTTLCPATQVATAGGMAAFLRPESAVGTATCPGGSLNGDADVADGVAELWTGSGNPQSLGVAARAVAMSSSTIAAIVDERGQNGTILNGDGDTNDGVVEVHPASVGGVWTNTGQAADALEVCGTAGRVHHARVGAGRRQLESARRRRHRPYSSNLGDASTNSLTNTQQEAEDFACGPTLVAFRTNEAAQGQDLNVDGDFTDDVLQVYDPATHLVHSSQQAITPCRIPECDPRIPYRVFATSVKFLSRECDQHGQVVSGGCFSGGTDLNDDGDADDLVIRLFDLASGTTRTIGTVTNGNPLAGGDPGTTSGTVYVASGTCVETAGPCSTTADCDLGSACEANVCTKVQGVCTTGADCPPGSSCENRSIVPASPDSDDDGVPDHLDNCPLAANTGQTDTDGDGAGDACDLETCGDGVIEGAEACDGVLLGSCAGACRDDCTCECANLVGDPKAKITVKTKKDAGQLGAKLVIALASYTNEPVTVRVDDGNSQPIVVRSVGALPPAGKTGAMWRFASKNDGLQQITLKSLGPKHPGMFQLLVKAKRWFSAAAADDVAANTYLTVTIGGQCFAHGTTKKTD